MLRQAVILFYVIIAGCPYGSPADYPYCANRGNKSEELQKLCGGYCFPAIKPVLVQLQSLKDELATLKIQQGFKKFGSFLYLFEEADKVPWNDAVKICRKFNAHLVDIKNEQEYKDVMANVDGHNYFHWVDGGVNNGECVEVFSGGKIYTERKCWEKNNFICKAN